MNKLLIASAMGAALISVPAMAADAPRPVAYSPVVPAMPGIQGYVGLGGAIINVPGEGSVNVAAFGGALNAPIGGLNVEFEGAGADIMIPGGEGIGYGRGGLHVFYRTPGMAIGGFAGFDSGEEALGPPISFWMYGGEAQAYLGAINLYGQVGGMSASALGSNNWFLRGDAQLFVTDNIAVSGDIKYIPDLLGEGVAVTTFGGTAEARFSGTPFSVFGTYRNSSFQGESEHITTGLLGIRMQVGNGTLHQQYTTGASMNILPIF